MELSDKKQLSSVLNSAEFSFKKSLGQNFIVDPTVCPRMAEAATADAEGILEIGAGAGVLTAELAKRAKKTVSVEIDERLRPVLSKTLGAYPNAEVVYGDILKTDVKKLIAEKFEGLRGVNVCANLPYYITSPVIMGLLSENLPLGSMTVMVQREAAERLCAEIGTRKAGAVSVAVRYYATPQKLFDVPKNCFMPQPKVDSAVIKLTLTKTPPVKIDDEKFFFEVVKAGFAMRRKTFVNSLSNTMRIEKQTVIKALTELNIKETVRVEELGFSDLVKIAEEIKKGI